MLRSIRNVLLIFIVYVYLIPFSHTNESLAPYTKKVFEVVNTYCSGDKYSQPLHSYIYFSKLRNEEIGVCEYGYNKFSIKISSAFWMTATEDERYELIFHEMFHCLFKKDHVENPNNYMYYRMVNLKKEIVIQQFTEDIKKLCKGSIDASN